MQKWITFLMTFLVGATASYVNADMGNVYFEAGYRNDDIDWKSGGGNSSSTLSRKTKFENVDIFKIGLRADADIGYNFYLRGGAYFGWALDGDFRESANIYGENATICDNSVSNRFSISSHNKNIVDERHVYGADVAVGYPLYLCDCTMMIAPVVGYAYDHQNFHVIDSGFGLNDCGIPSANDGCCCRRKYLFSWYGPFVGADFRYRPYNECWNIYLGFEYHFPTFNGRKHDFQNFYEGDNDHRRFHDADGWLVFIGADYDLCEGWTVGINAKFRDFSARKHGHHNSCCSSNSSSSYSSDSYYASGSGFNFNSSGRRSNNWNSYEINLTAGYEF